MAEVHEVSVTDRWRRDHVRDGPPGQAGLRSRPRRLRRHPRPGDRDRGQHARHRFHAAHGGHRGADVRGRQDPRLVLQARGPRRREGDADRPHDRPPAAPAVPQGLALRDAARLDPAVDRPRAPVRHPRHERRVGGPDGLQHPVPDPGRRRPHRQGRGQLRRQPDGGAAAHRRPRPRGRRHRRGHPDGRGGRQRDHRDRDARRARHRARRDQEALRRAARARVEGLARRSSRSPPRRSTRASTPRSRSRTARPLDEATSVAGQARAPGRHQGRRGAGARAVLGRPRLRDLRRVPRQGAARVRQAREEHDPPAHRRPQEAPGRPLGEGDPADHDRGRPAAAHARLRAVHARPDAGAVGRRARHHARGDAPGQPRARDVQALLPPLQLPAVLGGRGRLHARPEAP